MQILELRFCLLAQSLLNQLRAIFDQIIEFQNAQDSLYRSALEELSLRLQYEEKKQQREEEVRSRDAEEQIELSGPQMCYIDMRK